MRNTKPMSHPALLHYLQHFCNLSSQDKKVSEIVWFSLSHLPAAMPGSFSVELSLQISNEGLVPAIIYCLHIGQQVFPKKCKSLGQTMKCSVFPCLKVRAFQSFLSSFANISHYVVETIFLSWNISQVYTKVLYIFSLYTLSAISWCHDKCNKLWGLDCIKSTLCGCKMAFHISYTFTFTLSGSFTIFYTLHRVRSNIVLIKKHFCGR